MPCTKDGFTLYRRKLTNGDRPRHVYFFADEPVNEGEPADVPEGYEVTTTRSGYPVLRRIGA